MQDFDDLEPSDDELKEIEAEISCESRRNDLDINGGFVLYDLQTERIKLLAAIVESWADKPALESSRENIEHELKLVLADQSALHIARLAGSRSAREGVSLES